MAVCWCWFVLLCVVVCCLFFVLCCWHACLVCLLVFVFLVRLVCARVVLCVSCVSVAVCLRVVLPCWWLVPSFWSCLVLVFVGGCVLFFFSGVRLCFFLFCVLVVFWCVLVPCLFPVCLCARVCLAGQTSDYCFQDCWGMVVLVSRVACVCAGVLFVLCPLLLAFLSCIVLMFDGACLVFCGLCLCCVLCLLCVCGCLSACLFALVVAGAFLLVLPCTCVSWWLSPCCFVVCAWALVACCVCMCVSACLLAWLVSFWQFTLPDWYQGYRGLFACWCWFVSLVVCGSGLLVRCCLLLCLCLFCFVCLL